MEATSLPSLLGILLGVGIVFVWICSVLVCRREYRYFTELVNNQAQLYLREKRAANYPRALSKVRRRALAEASLFPMVTGVAYLGTAAFYTMDAGSLLVLGSLIVTILLLLVSLTALSLEWRRVRRDILNDRALPRPSRVSN